MKKLGLILSMAGMAMILSGCPIFLGDDDEEVPPDCGWGCADECSVDAHCPVGYLCNDGYCEATWLCDFDGGCPPGYVCDDRDTCVPGDDGPMICETNEDCPDGYCNILGEGPTGLCVDTNTCTEDEDCSASGPGLACDDRGVCVPEEAPCPNGECGCTSDEECEDGNLCISSRCTDSDSICIFDFECGTGSCIDNKCHASCEGDVGCPTGQACLAGRDICVDFEIGEDNCVFDEDCGETGFRCINATCHNTCTEPTECGTGETCSSGVCRADDAPIRNCSVDTADCVDGMVCSRGFCRMPCAGDINCIDQGEMGTCDAGFCRFQEELTAPECSRASECVGDASCVNGSCVSSSLL